MLQKQALLSPVQAAVEHLATKQHILKTVEQVVPKNTVISTTTSSLLVRDIASALPKSLHRVIGMHFFQPVHFNPLIEVVRTEQTTDDTLETSLEVCRKMRRTVVQCKDSNGFIHNRLFTVLAANADILVDQGNSLEDVETAARHAIGLRMGPLAMADYLGLDFAKANADNILPILQDGEYMLTELFLGLLKNGHYGIKTGKGYYDYSQK